MSCFGDESLAHWPHPSVVRQHWRRRDCMSMPRHVCLTLLQLILVGTASALQPTTNHFSLLRTAVSVRSSSPVSAITRLTESSFRSLIDETRKGDHIAVVEFSADHCVACKGTSKRISSMANGWPEEINAYQLSIESCEGQGLFKSLGIRKVPHIQILANGEAVESFHTKQSEVAAVISEKLVLHAGHLDFDMRPRLQWLRGLRSLGGSLRRREAE